mmetsp:Transcript_7416/g.7633  ORF Transcript_7416/g.7633 Transcript_7416/m.7633 type:complete len:1197 (+) Transcript_7416:193-3783(+)
MPFLSVKGFLLAFQLVAVLGGKFRFWDIPQAASIGVTYSDVCEVFGASNIAKVSQEIACEETSPCSNDTTIPQIACGTSNTSTSILSIDFSDRDLEGFLPTSFGELSSLTHLDLSGNKYSGTIPSTFALDIPSLKFLDLSSNALTGAIPSSFCSMTSLTSMRLKNNNLKCYHSCYSTNPFLNDFVGVLPQCSSLVTDTFKYVSPAVRKAFAGCSTSQNPNSQSWSDRDFCTFYEKNKCPSSVVATYTSMEYPKCPPSCISSPIAYCKSYAVLSLGCNQVTYSISDTHALEAKCLAEYQAKQVTKTKISFDFSFNITEIDVVRLRDDLGTSSSMKNNNYLVLQSLSDASGIPYSIMKIRKVFIPDGENVTHAMWMANIATTIESYGRSQSNVDGVIEELQSDLYIALNPIDNDTDSQFISIMKELAQTVGQATFVLSSNVRLSNLFVVDQQADLVGSIGDTFITNSTGNTPPIFTNDTTEFAVTVAPTMMPTPTFSPSVATVSPSAVPTPSEFTELSCFDITVVDLYGDGWDTASLAVCTSDGESQNLAPTCDKNPLGYRKCFDPMLNADGDYAVLKVVGFAPKMTWEIYWRAQITKTQQAFSGNYYSALELTYRKKVNQKTGRVITAHIEMTYSDKLVTDDKGKHCQACRPQSLLLAPTLQPTDAPTEAPSSVPSLAPSISLTPTMSPTVSQYPTGRPSISQSPTSTPTNSDPPTGMPSKSPSAIPSVFVAGSKYGRGSHPNTDSSSTYSDKENDSLKPKPKPVPKAEPMPKSADQFYYESTNIVPSKPAPEPMNPISAPKPEKSISPPQPMKSISDSEIQPKDGPKDKNPALAKDEDIMKGKKKPELSSADYYVGDYTLAGYQNTWYSSAGLSAMFYVSFANEDVFFSGTLCGKHDAQCSVRFPDGDYKWRVTGSVHDHKEDIEWRFCGVAGKASADLSFTVKDGNCIPKKLEYASISCVAPGSILGIGYHLAEAKVAIHGVMELEGMGEGPLSAEETVLLRSAIAQEFRDAQVDNTPLYEDVTSVEPLMTHSSTRRLEDETESSANTKQVLFKVKMSMPTFDVKELKTYLDQSMSSGLFVTRVRALSNTASNMKMQGLTKASLLDLRVIHETLENKTFSIEASLVMAVCGIAGLVFSILLLKSLNHKTEQGYAHLKTTDIDTTDSQTNGYSEVTATDMDVTINSEAGLIQESGV